MPAHKEAWEMTQREYAEPLQEAWSKEFAKRTSQRHGWHNEALTKRIDKLGNELYATIREHKQIVKKAIAEGKPVPQHVLNDYPELQPEQTMTDTQTESRELLHTIQTRFAEGKAAGKYDAKKAKLLALLIAEFERRVFAEEEPAPETEMQYSTSVRHTAIDKDYVNSLPVGKRSQILALVNEFKKLNYIDASLMLPTQWSRTTERERKKISETALQVFEIEAKLKELLKPDEQISRENKERILEELKSKEASVKNWITFFETTYPEKIASNRSNPKKRTYEEHIAELARLQTKIENLNAAPEIAPAPAPEPAPVEQRGNYGDWFENPQGEIVRMRGGNGGGRVKTYREDGSFANWENRKDLKFVRENSTEPAPAPEPAPETKPAPETPATKDFTPVVVLPLSEIHTNENNYQPRQALNEPRVQAIIDEHKLVAFAPFIVWRNPDDGLTYLLTGHHRLEAAKRMGKKQAQVMYFEGTWEDAKEIAAIENTMRTEQTPIENANVLRKKRKSGTAEKVIRSWCKGTLLKNCNDAYRISLLNEENKGIDYARSFYGKDAESYDAITKMLTWIGQLKDDNNFELTKTQENELFEHLWENYRHGKQFGFYKDFEKGVKKVVERVFELGVNTGQSLNFGAWEDTSSNAAKNYDEIKKQLEKELDKANDRLTEKREEGLKRLISTDEKERITQAQFNAGIEKYEEQVTLAQKNLLLHLQQEYKVKSTGKESEMALFGLGAVGVYDDDGDGRSENDVETAEMPETVFHTADTLPEAPPQTLTTGNGFYKMSDVAQTELTPLRLYRLRLMLRNLNSPFKALIWGPPSGGKSMFSLAVADDLSRNAPTLYLITEPGEKIDTGRLNARIQRVGIRPDEFDKFNSL
jgi:hypothetical protein